MAKRTLKQVEAWKRNWSLYLLSGFKHQLRNYRFQTQSDRLSRLEEEVHSTTTRIKEEKDEVKTD